MLRKFDSWQIPMFVYTGKWDDPALLVDMRLGKSLVTLRRVKSYKASLNLIVAPVSAIYDWTKELEQEGEFDYCLLIGKRKKRLQLLEEKHKWYILNTEGWQWIPEICEVSWNSLIFDESTAIRNPKAKITKFFCKYFRDVQHRFILTGTPNPETDLDFFCQFLFLDGGETLGKNFYHFRAKHFRPDWFGGNWKATKTGHKFITEAIGKRAFMLQRTDVKGIKGFKAYKTLTLELPEDLRETYRIAEEEFILEYKDIFVKSKYGVSKYNWLRQLTSGLIDGKLVWSGKLDLIVDLVQNQFKDEQVVIYADFIEEIEVLNSLLLKAKVNTAILSGKVPKTDRLNIVRDFGRGLFRVILGQNLAVTFGTNLSTATAGIYLSRPLRSLVRRQTEERIVTPRKEELSLIYDILIENTVDFDIYERLQKKINDSQLTFDLAKKLSQRINLNNNKGTVLCQSR